MRRGSQRVPLLTLIGLAIWLGALTGLGCAGQFRRLRPDPPESPTAIYPSTVPAIWVSGYWTWYHNHYTWVPRYGVRPPSGEHVEATPPAPSLDRVV